MKEVLKERIKERKSDFVKSIIGLSAAVVVFLVIMLFFNDSSDGNRSTVVSFGVVSFLGIIFYIIELISLLLSKNRKDE